MKRKFGFLCAVLLGIVVATPKADACTNLIVAKGASTDGSVIISYSADSHTLYGELYHWAARDWAKGTMRQIVEWDTNKPLGFIPEVAHTYNVIGNVNEHQVAIAETTWGGRPELAESDGIMDYGSLIYVALQRSKTAREAIDVMTNLVKEYGYHSSGESFSIADKNEVWILEMIGKGKGRKGAVWVAVRIPDNAISAHANQARIQQIDFKSKDYLYSPDVVSFAREMGFFKGADKDFSFQEAYNPYTEGGLRGCEARVWAFFNKFNSRMGKYEAFIRNQSKDKMPLYIVPDRKLSVADVRDMMRDHYEGTSLCMTNDPGAGPYKVPYRWRPMSFEVDGKEYVNERAIATQQTGFVFVAQLRNWLPDAIGGVNWFGVDDADMAVMTPIYCSTTRVPECFRQGNGDMMHFSWTSAFWIHNWVANMAYHRYDQMIADIRPVQRELEGGCDRMLPIIDKQAQELYAQDPAKAVAFLTNYSNEEAEKATARWKRLGEYLMVKYMDGNRKKEENGRFKTNGYGFSAMPDFPGYSQEYYRQIATSEAAERLIKKEKEQH
ncbi:peptidase C69 [Porphyromonas gulae]|uniref:dipeptidase n=1 Tax=Porphyromonas gulae TaxID=111105 RepID=UPI00037C0FE0|nr:C69 family dipeptidase [Porphyromonas gulae]KGN68682.1 peptidase C69 [Porphyromonas gulae]KGN75286.1 peptidase C69 [Porphyromonas gulae]KGN79024.1 peptidase C69 [Porphyromonas gulae]KGN92288.1 peptidase C69 [Porphyromonas gulae]